MSPRIPSLQSKGADSARWALRAETALCHENVERLYVRLNFARQDHRQHFLLAHFLAYRHMLPSLAGSETQAALEHNISLLAEDLHRLGIAGFPGAIACPVPPNAGLGIRYVIAGSSFGKKVLARRWETATRAPAPGFLLETTLQAQWSDVAADLERLTGQPETLKEAICDAKLCFAVFETAFLAASDFLESDDVLPPYEELLRYAI